MFVCSVRVLGLGHLFGFFEWVGNAGVLARMSSTRVFLGVGKSKSGFAVPFSSSEYGKPSSNRVQVWIESIWRWIETKTEGYFEYFHKSDVEHSLERNFMIVQYPANLIHLDLRNVDEGKSEQRCSTVYKFPMNSVSSAHCCRVRGRPHTKLLSGTQMTETIVNDQ